MTSSGSLGVQLLDLPGGGQAFDANKLITRNGSALREPARVRDRLHQRGDDGRRSRPSLDQLPGSRRRVGRRWNDLAFAACHAGKTGSDAIVHGRRVGGATVGQGVGPEPIGSDGSTVASRSFRVRVRRVPRGQLVLVWLRRPTRLGPSGYSSSSRGSACPWTRSPIIGFTRGLSEQVATTKTATGP